MGMVWEAYHKGGPIVGGPWKIPLPNHHFMRGYVFRGAIIPQEGLISWGGGWCGLWWGCMLGFPWSRFNLFHTGSIYNPICINAGKTTTTATTSTTTTRRKGTSPTNQPLALRVASYFSGFNIKLVWIKSDWKSNTFKPILFGVDSIELCFFHRLPQVLCLISLELHATMDMLNSHWNKQGSTTVQPFVTVHLFGSRFQKVFKETKQERINCWSSLVSFSFTTKKI